MAVNSSDSLPYAYVADLHRLKGLYLVIPQERPDPSEIFEGLTHTYITKERKIITDHDLGKKKLNRHPS